MFSSAILLSLAALGSVSAAPLSHLEARNTTVCYSGVYAIGARGTTEDPGNGKTQSVITGILGAIPNSGSIALDYPASAVDPTYPDSVTDGIKAMTTLVQNYVDSCPGKIVLVGFSQGANVISDMLAGGTDKPAPLAAHYAARSKLLHTLAC